MPPEKDSPMPKPASAESPSPKSEPRDPKTDSSSSPSSRQKLVQKSKDGISSPVTGGVRRALQKQDSTMSESGRVRAFSVGSYDGRDRTISSSSQSYARRRRSSMSMPHSNSIPFDREVPTMVVDEKETDGDEDIRTFGTATERTAEVPFWTSRRALLSLICFVGFFCLYSQRVNLSVGIVCMVKSQTELIRAQYRGNSTNSNSTTNYTIGNGTIVITTTQASTTPSPVDDDGCPALVETSGMEGEFTWDKKVQGFILGAFFWGYTAMQIPSGWLSDRFGPRLTVSCGMFTVAVLTILTPFMAWGSPFLLLVGRGVIGIGEAMMYPGQQSLWAKWSPPHERSRLVGFAFGGSQLGNALTFPIAGLLCAYGFHGGWPSVFYVIGILGFLWCCLFVFYARNTPAEMKGISELERTYIEHSLGVHSMTDAERKRKQAEGKPWKKIFTSGAVWAILVTNACGNYGAYMLLTQMPTYMKEVLHFDIKSNGVFSMIPYLAFWVMVILAGQIADFFIAREILSIEWTRKLCACTGTVIPGIFLVILGYMDCTQQTEAVILLTLSMAFCGFQFSSFFINHGDIAPRFAGTVFGVTNTGASIPGIIAPYVVGALTPNKTAEEWRITFFIAAVVYVLGAIFYLIFAKGEVQDWAKEADEDEAVEEMQDLKKTTLGGIAEQESDEEDADVPLTKNGNNVV